VARVVLAVVQRRAHASSVEQMAMAVASAAQARMGVKQMEQGRSRGERGRDEVHDSPTWPGQAGRRRWVASTRWLSSDMVSHCVGLKFLIQRSSVPTDSANC